MAENLNRPADFSRTQKPPVSPMNPILIPPSEFEKPAFYSKSELEKAKQQILFLREENDKLKLSALEKPSQIRLAAQSPSFQNDYADELIKRQVTEITDLKSELQTCRQTYEQQVVSLERQCRLTEDDCDRRIRLVEDEKKAQEDDFEHKLSRLTGELQSALEEAQREGAVLREKFHTDQSSLLTRVTELEAELNSTRTQGQLKLADLERQLREKSALVEEMTGQVRQLRTYITDKEQTYKPAQVWKAEKEVSDNKLQMAEAEKEKLQSELDLMGVRFKSLNDILSVQEEELSQGKADGIGKKKIHDQIITKWRHKVYALMVQLKSADIVNRNDVNNFNQRVKNLEDQLSSQSAEMKVLEHSLEEKSAQLKLEMNRSKHLSEELSQTHQVAVKLDDQSRESGTYLCQLRQMVNSQAEKNEETMAKLEEKSLLLKTLIQRVGFAAGRMEVLKAQLMRKVAFTETVQTNSRDISRKSMSVSRVDEEFSRDSEDHLCQELERLVQERDSLATQMQQDTSKWTQRLTQTRTQYETDLSTMRKSVQELTVENAKKSKTCADLTNQLTTLQEETKEREDTIAQLQAELDRYAKGMDIVLTDQKVQDEAEYSSRLVEVEKKLNESKREHAKTVVSLRQMERSHTRELERSRTLLATTETHLGHQVQRLQAQVLALERERNLMMAILKQEGLLHHIKSAREPPVPLHSKEPAEKPDESHPEQGDMLSTDEHACEDDRDGKDTDGGASMKERKQEDGEIEEEGRNIEATGRGETESVASVLQDLKTLTAAIFDEDEEDDDDDNLDENDEEIQEHTKNISPR